MVISTSSLASSQQGDCSVRQTTTAAAAQTNRDLAAAATAQTNVISLALNRGTAVLHMQAAQSTAMGITLMLTPAIISDSVALAQQDSPAAASDDHAANGQPMFSEQGGQLLRHSDSAVNMARGSVTLPRMHCWIDFLQHEVPLNSTKGKRISTNRASLWAYILDVRPDLAAAYIDGISCLGCAAHITSPKLETGQLRQKRDLPPDLRPALSLQPWRTARTALLR